MSVVVYSNPNCIQCEQTKKYLTLKEIPFESKMIDKRPEIHSLIEEKGYRSAPIVVAGEDSWSGFRLEKLSALVERFAQEE
jgi:glutaredoxin-like protein NrdH